MARYINRSRAAVICFGGWGLQTMLHLWPRVRFIQEERRILGIDREFPDLNRQTAFACVMPHPIPEEHDGRPLSVVYPAPSSAYPEPYYVEKKLLTSRSDSGEFGLTSSEVWADRLFKSALAKKKLDEKNSDDGSNEAQYIQPLAMSEPFGYKVPNSSSRLWREDMFAAGIAWAEPVVKALLRHVIDPTRLDNIQTLDPYVQTNIYVVASLAEPLTSALIWPIISELTATLGTRNIARVIAFLSTGSFALDDTAAIEEAACHTALREIESLTGVSRVGQKELAERVRLKQGWSERVGLPLFDRIYMLDKEKTNAALARDAHELAVLTGNVIEAFLTADGATHVETRLGPDIDAQAAQRRYSLVGAANDYVPLADYIDAAIRDEQKRIVQSLVVPQDDAATVEASLKDLKAERDKAVKDLMRSGTMRMFETETALTREGRRWRRRLGNAWNRRRQPEGFTSPLPDWLPELRIARSYLLPDSVRERLRRQRHPWQWRLEFNDHVTALAGNIEPELRTQRFARAWGIPYHYPASTSSAQRVLERLDNPSITAEARQETLLELGNRQNLLKEELGTYTERTWATRWRNDQRVIPHAMFEALRISVNDACAVTKGRPDGLLRANTRLKSWREECEVIVEELGENAADPEDIEWSQHYAGKLDTFERRFASAAGNYPQRAAIWARAILGGFFITFLVFNWLLFELRLNLTQWQVLLIGVGCIGVTAALAGLVEGLALWRLQRLKQQRIVLAQERLSRSAEQYVRSNLHSVYRRLGEVLGDLQEEIDSTVESLRKWSKAEDKIHVLPQGIERSHLRAAHLSDAIWERVKSHVQSERSPAENLPAETLFLRAWSTDGKAERLWYEAGQKPEDRLAQRIRLALELPFNRREQVEHVVEVETLRRLIDSRLEEERASSAGEMAASRRSRMEIEEELTNEMWCAFRNQNGCSACSIPDGCPLVIKEADAEQGTPPAWPLHNLYIEYLQRATGYLHPSGAIFPGGSKETIQQIIGEFAIEKLIIGIDSSLAEAEALDRRRDFVEESVARAKPAGNHELVDPFEDSLVDIEFGVTPEGAKSPFEPIFRDRKVSLLPSQDPTSITTVRTVNWLALSDLLFVDRCRTEFIRLDDDNRKDLALLSDLLSEKVGRELYDLPKGNEQAKYVRYQPIVW